MPRTVSRWTGSGCCRPHRLPSSRIAAPPSARHRVEMLRLAVGGHPAIEISTIEIDRGGVSYTVDTLAEIHAQQPEAELFLLMGADTLAGPAALARSRTHLRTGHSGGRSPGRGGRAQLRPAARGRPTAAPGAVPQPPGDDADHRADQHRDSRPCGPRARAFATARRGRSRSTSRPTGCTASGKRSGIGHGRPPGQVRVRHCGAQR